MDHRGHRGHRRDLRRDQAARDRPQPRPVVRVSSRRACKEGDQSRPTSPRPPPPPRTARRADRAARREPSAWTSAEAADLVAPPLPGDPPEDAVHERASTRPAESSDAASTASLIATDGGHVVAVAAARTRRPAGSSDRGPPCARRSTPPRAPRAAGRCRGRARRPRRPALARTAGPRGRPRATTRGRQRGVIAR